jgi:hypothetical protein
VDIEWDYPSASVKEVQRSSPSGEIRPRRTGRATTDAEVVCDPQVDLPPDRLLVIEVDGLVDLT